MNLFSNTRYCICIVGLLCACAFFLPSSSVQSTVTTATATASGAPPKEQIEEPVEQTSEAVSGHVNRIVYYAQTDPAWAGHLYGGSDSMSDYGCGPTTLASAVSSLLPDPITPIDGAVWSAQNGCFARGSGSHHRLIPDGAKAYGLTVEKLNPATPDTFRTALSFKKLLVLLMGPGDFTTSGHFIIVYGYNPDGTLLVADPASQERSSRSWPAETIIAQLSSNAQAGGPVWVISSP